MNEVNHSNFPEVIAHLCTEIEHIKQLLIERNTPVPPVEDQLLTVQEIAAYLHLSVPTVYGLISKGELPVMKRSKRNYALKSELLNYLRGGKKKTISEIEEIAEQYIANKNK